MPMPAGKYYIGDLCYVMHPEWEEYCAKILEGGRCLDGEFTLKDGRRFATYNTMFGDGIYHPNIGGSCSVDAGMIGCIRVEDIRDETYKDITKLGIIVEFDREFNTWGDEGIIHFGHVSIDTSSEEDLTDSEEEGQLEAARMGQSCYAKAPAPRAQKKKDPKKEKKKTPVKEPAAKTKAHPAKKTPQIKKSPAKKAAPAKKSPAKKTKSLIQKSSANMSPDKKSSTVSKKKKK